MTFKALRSVIFRGLLYGREWLLFTFFPATELRIETRIIWSMSSFVLSLYIKSTQFNSEKAIVSEQMLHGISVICDWICFTN